MDSTSLYFGLLVVVVYGSLGTLVVVAIGITIAREIGDRRRHREWLKHLDAKRAP